jgi:hypothetical protein
MTFNARALAVFLVIFGAFYRVFRAEFLPDWPNFSPVLAIAFCGGLVFSGGLAAAVPLAALFVSDLLLNAHYHVPLVNPEMVAYYGCYAIAILTGRLLRGAGVGALLAGLVGNSLLFYIVTNTLAWIANPAYAQSAAGWLQALTVGLPQYPPTWVFFRNSLAGDLVFAALFLAAWKLAARPAETAAVPQHN